MRVAGYRGRGFWQFDCFGFSPSANLIPSGAPAKRIVVRAAAPAQLHDRVLAADRVGRAVQDVGRRRPARELAVDRDVERVDDVLDPHLGRDGVRALVDLCRRLPVCEWQSMMPGVDVLAARRRSRPRPPARRAPLPTAVIFPLTTTRSRPRGPRPAPPSRPSRAAHDDRLRRRERPALRRRKRPDVRLAGPRPSPRLERRRGPPPPTARVFVSGSSMPPPVDPDLRRRALASANGSPVSTARFGDLAPPRSCPSRSASPSCRAGTVVTAASASSSREAARDRLAHAPREVLDVVEARRREGEGRRRRPAATSGSTARGRSAAAARAARRSTPRRRRAGTGRGKSTRRIRSGFAARRPGRAAGTRRPRRRSAP